MRRSARTGPAEQPFEVETEWERVIQGAPAKEEGVAVCAKDRGECGNVGCNGVSGGEN